MSFNLQTNSFIEENLLFHSSQGIMNMSLAIYMFVSVCVITKLIYFFQIVFKALVCYQIFIFEGWGNKWTIHEIFVFQGWGNEWTVCEIFIFINKAWGNECTIYQTRPRNREKETQRETSECHPCDAVLAMVG